MTSIKSAQNLKNRIYFIVALAFSFIFTSNGLAAEKINYSFETPKVHSLPEQKYPKSALTPVTLLSFSSLSLKGSVQYAREKGYPMLPMKTAMWTHLIITAHRQFLVTSGQIQMVTCLPIVKRY